MVLDRYGYAWYPIHDSVTESHCIETIYWRRFIDDFNIPWKNVRAWKVTLAENIFYAAFLILVNCLFIYRTFTECLDAWSDVRTARIVSYDDVVNQTMWNNKFILIENKSCYVKHMAVHGIVKIGDLICYNGRFLESEKLLQARLSPIH